MDVNTRTVAEACDDEESQCEDGSDNCAAAIGPLALPLLDWKSFEKVHIVLEHDHDKNYYALFKSNDA